MNNKMRFKFSICLLKFLHNHKIIIILSLFILILSNFLIVFSKDSTDQIKNNLIAIYVENDNGEFQLSNEKKFPTDGYLLDLEKSSCSNAGILQQDMESKKIRLKVSSNDRCSLYFKKELPPSLKTLYSLNLKVNNNQINNFSTPATTDETSNGLFSMEDNYGTSYYFRGATENNYVRFAGFYWRIIRINGNGSLRIIYDGTKAHTNGTNDLSRFIARGNPYNMSYENDAKYVGWMYGGANGAASTSKTQARTNTTSSNIKSKVEEWYKTNILDKGYGSYIDDVIFCNDRTTASSANTWWTNDTARGFGSNPTAFGGFSRFKTKDNSWNTDPKPELICKEKIDSFTVSDATNGNAALTYPVGLITADEASLGGAVGGTGNTNYYLYKGLFYWTMTPRAFTDSSTAHMLIVGNTGTINQYNVSAQDGGTAPVINLTKEYAQTLKGNGTINNPFTT